MHGPRVRIQGGSFSEPTLGVIETRTRTQVAVHLACQLPIGVGQVRPEALTLKLKRG